MTSSSWRAICCPNGCDPEALERSIDGSWSLLGWWGDYDYGQDHTADPAEVIYFCQVCLWRAIWHPATADLGETIDVLDAGIYGKEAMP